MLRIGLVGAGRMGSLHARVVARRPETRIEAVIDRDPLRAERLASATGARVGRSIDRLFACDAVIVATPAAAHAETTLPLIAAGIPVLVEKPLAPSASEAAALVDAARAAGTPISCGFVERHNPVVLTAQRLMEDYGRALHMVATRHSPPDAIAADSVLHDLLVHDADLALRLCDGEWTGEVAGGLWHPKVGSVPEIADCVLTFDSGSVATLSASRMSQRKVRQINLSTPGALIELDLIRRTITVFRHVSHQTTDGSGYRAETVMDIPFVHEGGEPLMLQLGHFLSLMHGEADRVAELDGLLAPHEVIERLEDQAISALRHPVFGRGTPGQHLHRTAIALCGGTS